MFNIKLLNHWLYNVINNKVNDEILLLVFPNSNFQRKNIKDSFGKLETENYELIEIDSIKSIAKVEKNKNSIILGHPRMDIFLLDNLQRPILYMSLIEFLRYFLSDNHIENIKKSSIKEIIHNRYRYLYFYEQREPIALINTLNRKESFYSILFPSEYSQNEIAFSFIPQVFPSEFIFKYAGTDYIYLWKDIINKDILYLTKLHILTARLAILIYKITTLKLDDSTTRIGIYYRQKLGVKSKTIRLPRNIYMMPGHTTKAYDLTTYFDSIKS